MITPYGGDFDEDDTAYVDIYKIDGIRRDPSNGFGGAWGHYFGKYGDAKNMAISSWVGFVDNTIEFRLAAQGDNIIVQPTWSWSYRNSTAD